MDNIEKMQAARKEKLYAEKILSDGRVMTWRELLDNVVIVAKTMRTRTTENKKRNGCYNNIKPVCEYYLVRDTGRYTKVPKLIWDDFNVTIEQ